MNIQLSHTFTSFVNHCIESGLYRNQAEVVREALRRMIREEDTSSRIPNSETLEAFKDVEEGRTIKASNTSDLFKQLNN
jgi:putative addiction module CopG family antidote